MGRKRLSRNGNETHKGTGWLRWAGGGREGGGMFSGRMRNSVGHTTEPPDKELWWRLENYPGPPTGASERTMVWKNTDRYCPPLVLGGRGAFVWPGTPHCFLRRGQKLPPNHQTSLTRQNTPTTTRKERTSPDS